MLYQIAIAALSLNLFVFQQILTQSNDSYSNDSFQCSENEYLGNENGSVYVGEDAPYSGDGFAFGDDFEFGDGSEMISFPKLHDASQISLFLNESTPSGMQKIMGGDRWTRVRYRPLEIGVTVASDRVPDATRFWLNGLPADPQLLELVQGWSLESGVGQVITYGWKCPPLGRIVLQVEFQIDGRWIGPSSPLRFQVSPPATPTLNAAGGTNYGLSPIQINGQRIACQETLVVQFSGIDQGASIVADCDGYGPVVGESQVNCCYVFDLKSRLPAGEHTLSFRQFDQEHCGLSSSPSKRITVDLRLSSSNEVAVDNIHSYRRMAMLRELDQIARNEIASTDQIEWMRSLLRNPSIDCAPPTASSEVEGTDKGEPDAVEVIGEGVEGLSVPPASQTLPAPAKPAAPQPSADPFSKSTKKRAGKFVNTQVQEEMFVLRSEHEDCSRLLDQLQSWSNRMRQSNRLASVLETLENDQHNSQQAFRTNKVVSTIDFDLPAVFPHRGAAQLSVDASIKGLVILEGMRLQTTGNGNYKLTFSYIPPSVPTTAYLQLQFRSGEPNAWKTLTLPPCVIPEVSYEGNATNLVKQYEYEGYSSALERVAGYVEEVRRKGSAVFGYGIYDSSGGMQF